MGTTCYTRSLVIAFTFAASIAQAQLSVVATAGTTGPTSYTTLKTAFDAINAGTHRGDITITVNANTNETAAAVLNRSGAGSSSYNSVLVKPAATTNPVISGTTANPIIVLDGANRVTIDGSNTAGGTSKNLSIVNTNTGSLAAALVLVNGASLNVVKNNIIQSAVGANSGTIVLSTASATQGNNFNTIENNDITKSAGGTPFAAIFNIGTANRANFRNTYRNNRIFDFKFNGYMDGLGGGAEGYSDSTLIEGNEFYNTAPKPDFQCAIYIGHTGVHNMMISRNRIHSLPSAGEVYGILLYESGVVTIVNNMIALASSTSDIYGIAEETDAGAVIKIYYNTIHISGTTADFNSFAFYKNWFSTNGEVRDNIFVNTRVNTSGSKGQYAIVHLGTGTFNSNFNDLFSTGNTNNYIAFTNPGSSPTYYATLAQWQATGKDLNSISVNPVFVSATDLHLTPVNCRINNKGIPITAITTDIDANTRSTATPDMGADEFESTLAPTIITTQPANITTCLQQSATFTVSASGSGTLTYQWKKNAVNITGATAASYTLSNITAGDAGTYSVEVTGTCETTVSNNVTLTVSGPCTAIQPIDPGIETIILKPNPVYHTTILYLYSARTTNTSWQIVDIQGRIVMSINKLVNAGSNQIELNLSKLGAGNYFIKGQTPKGRMEVIRMVKL